MDKFYHISGPMNIANMATRAEDQQQELAEGGLWQLGPQFLRTPREQWPISRQFKKEERRTKFFTMFSSIELSDMSKKDKVKKTIAIYITQKNSQTRTN